MGFPFVLRFCRIANEIVSRGIGSFLWQGTRIFFFLLDLFPFSFFLFFSLFAWICVCCWLGYLLFCLFAQLSIHLFFSFPVQLVSCFFFVCFLFLYFLRRPCTYFLYY